MFHAKKAVHFCRLKMLVFFSLSIKVVKLSCTLYGKCTFFTPNTNFSWSFSSWKNKIFSYYICSKRLTLILIIAYSHFLSIHSKWDLCYNNNIYGVFIETRYFIFLAVLKNELFKALTRYKRSSPVIIPRKQFVYQELIVAVQISHVIK